jgi:hypothetical protein
MSVVSTVEVTDPHVGYVNLGIRYPEFDIGQSVTLEVKNPIHGGLVLHKLSEEYRSTNGYEVVQATEHAKYFAAARKMWIDDSKGMVFFQKQFDVIDHPEDTLRAATGDEIERMHDEVEGAIHTPLVAFNMVRKNPHIGPAYFGTIVVRFYYNLKRVMKQFNRLNEMWEHHTKWRQANGRYNALEANLAGAERQMDMEENLVRLVLPEDRVQDPKKPRLLSPEERLKRQREYAQELLAKMKVQAQPKFEQLDQLRKAERAEYERLNELTEIVVPVVEMQYHIVKRDRKSKKNKHKSNKRNKSRASSKMEIVY